MKKGLTEMLFILDRSGSMSGLEGGNRSGRRGTGRIILERNRTCLS